MTRLDNVVNDPVLASSALIRLIGFEDESALFKHECAYCLGQMQVSLHTLFTALPCTCVCLTDAAQDDYAIDTLTRVLEDDDQASFCDDVITFADANAAHV